VVLRGWRASRAALDAVVERAHEGVGAMLFVVTQAGIGKKPPSGNAISRRRPIWRCSRTAGVESEMELAFAALHHLLVPLRPRI
jgi:hypothetical protein